MNTIVFWDWNGTILNDIELNHKVLNSILKERGLKEIDIDEYRRLFKLPIIEFYYSLDFSFANEKFEEVAEEYNYKYKKVFDKIDLVPGIEEILSSIKKKGITQYIVSALNQKDLDSQVKQKGISKYFERIVGIDNIQSGSKKQKAIDLVNTIETKNFNLLFIGDMDHDFEVAESIGAKCILYNKGHQLLKQRSDYIIIENIQEIMNYI